MQVSLDLLDCQDNVDDFVQSLLLVGHHEQAALELLVQIDHCILNITTSGQLKRVF